MISFSEFLKEASGDCEAWFQDKLFSGKKGKFQVDMGPEENTAVENNIVDMLDDFVHGDTMNGGKQTKELDKLLQCRGYFENWLTPKAKHLLRGTEMESEQLITIMKGNPNPPIKQLPGIKGMNYFVYESSYTPKSKMQSWTTTPVVAAYFSQGQPYFGGPETGYVISINNSIKGFARRLAQRAQRVPVIHVAKTDKSFFGSKKFGNKISKQVIRGEQDEVYRIGSTIKTKIYVPEPLNEVLWDKIEGKI